MMGTYTHKTPEERAVFTYQAMAYKLGKKDNKDDILDASAYGEDVRTEHWHLIRNNKVHLVDHSNSAVVIDNTPF
jgi:hypothetical protein